MAKRIPEQIIEEIKEKSDIVDIVSSYVTLSKRTGQNLFGLCPFHHEKTPSFSVAPLKQIYHCFGCGKGGDVVNFIMNIEHMNYPEALRFLADRCGVIIPDAEDDERYKEAKEQRERLYALNTEAARYFYLSLNEKEAADAARYMEQRGISRSTAIKFGLGYAPDRWQGLADHLRRKGYTEEELKASGLFKVNRKGGLYDLFRGRLIFPIIDVMGKIIAFGGRVLDDSMPKYLNSPETPVYTKGRHLYGLNLAKRSRENRLVVVEGYMDCISLHQAGIDNAVASLGTALTEQQASLLRKYREDIILAYDMDRAGRLAALRNIDVMEQAGASPYVLQIPDGKDPDDYMKTHSSEDFKILADDAMKGLDYKFFYAKKEASSNGSLDKTVYQDKAVEILLSIKNPILREMYIARLAEELKVPKHAVSEQVENRVKLDTKKNYGKRQRQTQMRLRNRAEERPRPSESDQDVSETEKRTRAPEFTAAEAALIVNLCRYPDVYLREKFSLKPSWFKEKSLRPLAGEIVTALENKNLDEKRLFDLINEQEDLQTDRLSSQFGALFMKQNERVGDARSARIMLRQILYLRAEYYTRLSRYFSSKLDAGLPEDQEKEFRKRYKAALRAKQKCETSIRKIDEHY